MNIGIMNRSTEETVFTYTADRYKTFISFPETTHIQYEIAEGTDTRAYYIDNNIVRFNSEWVAPAEVYTTKKSEEFLERWAKFEELMADLAASNSALLSQWVTGEIMAGRVANDTASIRVAVKPHVDGFADAFRSVREDIRMYNYYTIDESVAAVERDTLLRTEERLTEWQGKINALIWG